MKPLVLCLLLLGALRTAAAPENFKLPPFPLPAFVAEGGRPTEITSTRLMRELHQAGLHGFDNFETADADYALFRSDSLGVLSAWLESVCGSVGFDLSRARSQNYDGTVFARLLDVATSVAALQVEKRALAMPIGIVICSRASRWGELPADNASDVYVIIATDDGMLIYDPPTRQLVPLADFPNKSKIVQIRF